MEEPVRKKMEKQFAGAKGNSLVRRVQNVVAQKAILVQILLSSRRNAIETVNVNVKAI